MGTAIKTLFLTGLLIISDVAMPPKSAQEFGSEVTHITLIK